MKGTNAGTLKHIKTDKGERDREGFDELHFMPVCLDQAVPSKACKSCALVSQHVQKSLERAT